MTVSAHLILLNGQNGRSKATYRKSCCLEQQDRQAAGDESEFRVMATPVRTWLSDAVVATMPIMRTWARQSARGTLSCEACKKYERSVQSLKNFSRVWITGSSNQKVSNVIDHATSEVHKASMARMRANSTKASGGSAALSTAIGHCLLTIDEETQARMRWRFDMWKFVVFGLCLFLIFSNLLIVSAYKSCSYWAHIHAHTHWTLSYVLYQYSTSYC